MAYTKQGEMCTKQLHIFEEITRHMKVGLNMNEALTFSSQTVELPRQRFVVSQAFSDMLSEGYAPFWSHVHVVDSINQQIL
jgi:hypothetical protein